MILPETITLHGTDETPSGTSVFGDPEYDDADGVEVPAQVTPLDATEDEVNRDTRINRYRVITEVEASLDGLTTIEWNGKTYTVQGEPRHLSSYRGAHHLEFDIRGVEG